MKPCIGDDMRLRLLHLLVRHGLDPVEAANIVGILMTDAYLGPLVRGEAPTAFPEGPCVQQLSEGIVYFAPGPKAIESGHAHSRQETLDLPELRP